MGVLDKKVIPCNSKFLMYIDESVILLLRSFVYGKAVEIHKK